MKKMLRIIIVLITLSVACCVVSLVINNSCPWVSNALLSVASSLMTGIVIYFITNARNAIQDRCKNEREQLMRIKTKSHELSVNALYFIRYHSLYSEDIDCDTFVRTTIEGAAFLCDELLSLPNELSEELNIDVENSDLCDMSSIEDDYCGISRTDDDFEIQQLDELLKKIADKMAKIEAHTLKPLMEREDSLSALNRSPL